MADHNQYNDMRVGGRSGEVENPYSLESSTTPLADLSSVPGARHPLSYAAIPFEGPHTYMWKYPLFRLPQLRQDEEEGEGVYVTYLFNACCTIRVGQSLSKLRVCGHEASFRRPSGYDEDER